MTHKRKPPKRKLRTDEWSVYQREQGAIRRDRRKAAIKMATPIWVDKAELAAVYRDRGRLSVDHIVPIQHSKVCGLHVPWNLRYMPGHLNASKGNKFYTYRYSSSTKRTRQV